MQKIVGSRLMPAPALRPSAAGLKAASAVNDALPALLLGGRIAAPKGVYRFRTLEEANRQHEAWLAEAMAQARGDIDLLVPARREAADPVKRALLVLPGRSARERDVEDRAVIERALKAGGR